MAKVVIQLVGEDRFSGAAQAATGSLDKIARGATAAGKALTAIGAIGTAAFGAAAKVGMEFEAAMSNVASVAGATADEMDRLEAAAREMGATTAFSASQAADALYYLASSGMSVDEQIAALQPTMELAGATATDLASAADIVASNLKVFGLAAGEADRVTNVLAATVAASNTQLGQLAEGMSYAGPVAAALGKGIEEVAATMGVLANAGFKGTRAGTALVGALNHLMNASSAAEAALASYGVSLEDVNPKTHSLADIVRTLGDAGVTTGDLMLLFGQRAGPAMAALISQGADAIEAMQESITGTSKATEMYATQMDNLQGRLAELRSALEELALSVFGEFSGGLEGLVERVTDAVRWFTQWNKSLGGLPVKLAAVATALAAIGGPILLLVGQLPRIIAGFKAVGAAMTLVASGPALLVVAVLAAIAAGVLLATRYLHEHGKTWGDVWDWIVKHVTPIVEDFVTWLAKAIEAVTTWMREQWEELGPYLAAIWQAIVDDAVEIWSWMKAWWAQYGEDVIAILKDTWAVIEPILSMIWETIKSGVKIVADLLEHDWAGAWEEAGKLLDKIVGSMIAIIEALLALLVDLADFILTQLQAAFMALWDDLRTIGADIMTAMWQGMIDVWNNSIIGWFMSALWGLGAMAESWFSSFGSSSSSGESGSGTGTGGGAGGSYGAPPGGYAAARPVTVNISLAPGTTDPAAQARELREVLLGMVRRGEL